MSETNHEFIQRITESLQDDAATAGRVDGVVYTAFHGDQFITTVLTRDGADVPPQNYLKAALVLVDSILQKGVTPAHREEMRALAAAAIVDPAVLAGQDMEDIPLGGDE